MTRHIQNGKYTSLVEANSEQNVDNHIAIVVGYKKGLREEQVSLKLGNLQPLQ